jgi:hypothetical protein
MNLGVAAFWAFVAVIVVASIWKKKHSETLRHETMRLLIEKNQKIDETQLAELLNPKPPEWMGLQQKPSQRGDTYRVLRIIGTMLMFLALGFLLVGAWRGMLLGLRMDLDAALARLSSSMRLCFAADYIKTEADLQIGVVTCAKDLPGGSQWRMRIVCNRNRCFRSAW